MSPSPGTKVICIDATPIPINGGPGATGLDFTFPNGFIEEGTIYCVKHSIPVSDGVSGLYLTGLPIFIYGIEANWHSSRFRIVQPKQNQAKKQKVLPIPS